MIAKDKLKDVLQRPGLTRKDQALICLAVEQDRPKTIAQVRALALAGGLRRATDWNWSAVLASLSGKAVKTSAGWELNQAGKNAAAKLLGQGSRIHAGALASLRTEAARVTSTDVRAFVEEAIGCAEERFHRAAVVLSWVGAVRLLYDYVIANNLAAFNTEATRRNTKWKAAKTADDLARMDEFDFLQIISAISMIGKSVRLELEGCLKLRNGCGHPNSLKVGEGKVAGHVETLVLNVFSVFA